MYEDLEPIANLKFGEVVERVSRENGAKLSAAIADLGRRGLHQSGMMTQARLTSALEHSEQVCRGLYEIWLQLILQRNQGRISREDVDFIMERVNACARARTGNIAQVLVTPQNPAPEWVLQRAQTKMQSVASGIDRELEIKLREQEAFPKPAVNAPDPKPPVIAPDLRFRAFLRSFGESWLTQMSGPLTVPFAIAALVLPGFPKLLFAGLAIVCGVFSSYRVWRAAHRVAPPPAY
jgi:hypothetical protein